MSKLDLDSQRWEKNQPQLGEGWVRIPVSEGNPFAALPDDVEEAAKCTVLVEYQPSAVMGWGMAALWYSKKPEHVEDLSSPVIHEMSIKSDVGIYEPAYERVVLVLHEDGSVTWKDFQEAGPGY